MRIGGSEFDTEHHTYVCGILNVTPDSFSDGGSFREPLPALRRVEEMIGQGMALLDIGGESTRPGAQPIGAKEEIERLLPVVRAVRKHFQIPISLDTYKAEVAREMLAEGVDCINDIWGLKYDPQMAGVIAKGGAACCLMHNRRDAQPQYQSLIPEILEDLEESLHLAYLAGIARENILLDPGIGFGKSYEENMEVLSHLEAFRRPGLPLLIGCSRKSVIGETLRLPVEEREEGTLVTTVAAVIQGVSFVRVHDVEKNVRAVKMAEAIWRRT